MEIHFVTRVWSQRDSSLFSYHNAPSVAVVADGGYVEVVFVVVVK